MYYLIRDSSIVVTTLKITSGQHKEAHQRPTCQCRCQQALVKLTPEPEIPENWKKSSIINEIQDTYTFWHITFIDCIFLNIFYLLCFHNWLECHWSESEWIEHSQNRLIAHSSTEHPKSHFRVSNPNIWDVWNIRVRKMI